MTLFKNLIFSIVAIVLFFVLLDLAFRPFILPGSYNFIEKRIVEEQLPQHKPKDEFRIFMFGESTMYGNHLYPRSTIAGWTHLYIENLIGPKEASHVRAVNFGRAGEDSQFISTAFIDLIPYQPDAVVFYTVHNDFILENRQKVLDPPRFTSRLAEGFRWLAKKDSFSRFLTILSVRAKAARQKNKQRPEAEYLNQWFDETKVKKYEEGMPLLEPGSADFQKLLMNWQHNVLKIVQAAQRKKIPVIFLMGISRWKDYPPFKSNHPAGMSAQARRQWEGNFAKAEEAFNATQYKRSLALYENSLALDPQYALVYYRMGQIREAQGEYQEANEFYRKSNDLDYFPIRGPSAVNEFYGRLREQHLPGVYFVDSQALFEAHSPHHIIDYQLVDDQLHPSMQGQALLAREISGIIARETAWGKQQQWHWDAEKKFPELVSQLQLDDDFLLLYYVKNAEYVGSYQERAIDFLKKALSIKPDCVQAQSHLAWLYVQTGEKKKAAGLYKSLNEQVPELAGAFFSAHPDIQEYVLSPQ